MMGVSNVSVCDCFPLFFDFGASIFLWWGGGSKQCTPQSTGSKNRGRSFWGFLIRVIALILSVKREDEIGSIARVLYLERGSRQRDDLTTS